MAECPAPMCRGQRYGYDAESGESGMAGKRIAALVYDSGPGALLAWRGSTVLHHVAAKAGGWPVERVLVVLGPDGEAALEAGGFGEAVVVLVTESEGTASLLRAGLDTLVRDGGVHAALLVPADHPDVDPAVVAELAESSQRSSAGLTVPKYRYAVGPPVIIGELLWGEMMNQEGDVDLVAFTRSRAESVDEVWFDQLAPIEVADASDLARLRA